MSVEHERKDKDAKPMNNFVAIFIKYFFIDKNTT